MIVISKISNKKLLKDHRYEVKNLWNGGSNQKWLEGKIELEFGRYSVDYFTDSSGLPIGKIDYKSVITPKYINFEDVSVGEILVCNSEHYKTMAKGSMYKIEKLKCIETERVGWGGKKFIHTEKTIKFEGLSRKLKFNGYSFRKLTPEENREISLNSILNNEFPKIVKTSDIRAIEFVPNKNKTLMEVISKTILDSNRHHLSIVDWSCQKTGEKLRIKKDDFNDLLEMKLSDILTLIEKQ
jgi:hypothetical protein